MGVTIFNISFDVSAITLSVCALLFVTMLRKFDRQWIYHIHILAYNILEAVCNMFGVLCRGRQTLFSRIIIPIANFGEFLFITLLSASLALYFFNCIETNSGKKFSGKVFFFTPHMLHTVFLIINIYFPIYYYIDDANVYHRAEFFLLCEAFGFIFGLMIFLLCFFNRKSLTKTEFVSSVVYIAFPLAGLAIAPFSYGLYPVLIASNISIAIMFCILLRGHIQEYVEKQNELAEMRMKVMLSQIQPHFIYNTLGAIQELCVEDPPEAERTVGLFSKYLRGNFDSLSQSEPVPFTQELEHVRTYIAIEKIRFGDRLNMVYELGTVDFDVPVLSIQPLIENAVKYGVTKREEGGTIILKTEDIGEAVRITVKDNGVGFDVSAPLSENRQHIGVENSKKRFLVRVGAEFDIKSEIGKGTTVTIIAPKKRIYK